MAAKKATTINKKNKTTGKVTKIKVRQRIHEFKAGKQGYAIIDRGRGSNDLDCDLGKTRYSILERTEVLAGLPVYQVLSWGDVQYNEKLCGQILSELLRLSEEVAK